MEPAPPAAIDPPANVLLVHAKRREPAACADLCHDSGATADLRISFADDRPDRPDPDAVTGRVGLLTIGDVLIEDTAESARDFDEPIVVDTVRNPTDLSAIGVAVSRFCKHWSDEQLTVCFDSLDALLRHTPPKEVFQFAHVLTNRLTSVDAYAHFHFDPTRHEDRVVSTFGSIFDAVVADEDSEESLPEATDEEVADLLAAWNDGADDEPDGGFDFAAEPSTEATDEEIARMLGE